MELFDLSGVWTCTTDEGSAAVQLPGTLDTNGVGHADRVAAPWHPDENTNDALTGTDVIATRLTRRHTYEGPVVFTRTLRFVPPAGRRVFLEVERSRHLTLDVNGRRVEPLFPASVSAPYVFEVTGLLSGEDEIALTCDNRYPGWPHDDIVFSSAATDETQTNWNGIIGYFRLRIEEGAFIHAVRVYPHGERLDVCAEVFSGSAWADEIAVSSEALEQGATYPAQGAAGMSSVWLRDIPLSRQVRRWDEDEGSLYSLTVTLWGLHRTVSFGVRDFAAREGRLVLNGRSIFLRSDTNCAVFPETGHWPMDVPAWREILHTYRAYGVNCVRFHSHCPPEAAFTAADEMGMLMQPELSHWNPRNAFASAESRAYYRAELEGIVRMLANHPSFVMLSLGNELHMGEGGQAYADEMLSLARTLDPTRLVASGSNNHYGAKGENPADDFYTSACYRGHALRATSSPMVGWLNEGPPDWRTDYAPAMRAIRESSQQPVVSFEVGQYEVLPDFAQLEEFTGVTRPDNLALIRDRVKAAGLLARWKDEVRASGELALLCYRAEVEAALRTEGLSGISLLGLQDFPGQGTALVGMLSSHLRPKPYAFAAPERFARFFTGVLPLALLPRLTYTAAETLTADVRMANYGRRALCGEAEWTLAGEGVSISGRLPGACARSGGLTDLGTLHIALGDVKKASRLTLSIALCGFENRYDVWVYPVCTPVCPATVHECRTLDDAARSVLEGGGTVYLAPDSTEEALPGSVRGQFSTDFWSVGTFPAQPGGMGLLIDAEHPLFQHFPTDSHTGWQWWPMASQRAVVLEQMPDGARPIVTLMDSYAYLRTMVMMLECRVGRGRLFFSSMGLHNLLQYPEARALQSAVYRYLAEGDSDAITRTEDSSGA